MASQHVVVGAGVVGTHVARLLAGAGHQVRIVTRSGSGPEHPLVERLGADASDAERMTALSRGAIAIHNAANPAYHRWPQDWQPIAGALLTAAERTGAVLVTCSNLYGYGEVGGPMTEDHPLASTGRKGRVRAAMWRDALAAHEASRVRATEVRGSSYLGAGAQSMIGDRVVPRLITGKPVRLLGDPDQLHSFTNPRDVARLMVAVATDTRAWGAPWHVPTAPPVTQRRAVEDLCVALGVEQVPVSRVPGWLVRAMGAASPTVREFAEVRHQYERPWVLDSSRAQATFGLVPTPWSRTIAEVAEHYRERSRTATSHTVTA